MHPAGTSVWLECTDLSWNMAWRATVSKPDKIETSSERREILTTRSRRSVGKNPQCAERVIRRTCLISKIQFERGESDRQRTSETITHIITDTMMGWNFEKLTENTLETSHFRCFDESSLRDLIIIISSMKEGNQLAE